MKSKAFIYEIESLVVFYSKEIKDLELLWLRGSMHNICTVQYISCTCYSYDITHGQY
jgi:hypothetical protein